MTNDDQRIPYFFIWLMKPYSGRGMTITHRIYNYRLSRARRENLQLQVIKGQKSCRECLWFDGPGILLLAQDP